MKFLRSAYVLGAGLIMVIALAAACGSDTVRVVEVPGGTVVVTQEVV